MIVLGAHVRVSGGRYLAGFALVRDDTLVDAWHLPSPASEEGGCLAELHRFALGLFDSHSVDAFSLKGSEAGTAKALIAATHAEGALLAAAGTRGVKSKVWTGPGYRAAVGARNNAHVLEVTEAALSGDWSGRPECQQAAAAGLAAVRKPF